MLILRGILHCVYLPLRIPATRPNPYVISHYDTFQGAKAAV